MSTRDAMTVPQWDPGPTIATTLSWRGDASALYAGDLCLGKCVKWFPYTNDYWWRMQLGEEWIGMKETKLEAQIALYQTAVDRMAGDGTKTEWKFRYEAESSRVPAAGYPAHVLNLGTIPGRDSDAALWFAWRPVRTDRGWRWFVEVRRIREGDVISYLVRKRDPA